MKWASAITIVAGSNGVSLDHVARAHVQKRGWASTVLCCLGICSPRSPDFEGTASLLFAVTAPRMSNTCIAQEVTLSSWIIFKKLHHFMKNIIH